MDVQMHILKFLFINQEITYRDLIGSDDVSLSPNIARQELNELIHKGFIKEEGRKSWKGDKKLYSLTEKGREEYICITFDSLNKALKDVKDISDSVRSDPKNIEEWTKMIRKAFLETKNTEDTPVDERIKTVVTETRRIYGPLLETYKNLHNMICQLTAPQEIHDSAVFIGFTKEGSLCFIPNESLKKKGFDLP